MTGYYFNYFDNMITRREHSLSSLIKYLKKKRIIYKIKLFNNNNIRWNNRFKKTKIDNT